MDGFATSPLPFGGSPTLQSRGQNQKWPTSGRIGYVIDAVWEVPNASEGGRESQVAHKWAKWLHHPCHMGGPQRFRAGDKIRSGRQVDGLVTSPLPYGGVTNALERGTKSEVAHKWMDWLHHPCRMGGPQPFRAGDKTRSGPQVDGLATSPPGDKIRSGPQLGGLATSPPGDKIRSGPQVGGLATSPLPYGGSPTL